MFSKKYSQKTPPSNYTGIEGGGYSGTLRSKYGTAGLAAGSGKSGDGSRKRSAAAAAGSPGAGGDLPGTAAPDDRMATGTDSEAAPGGTGQRRGPGRNRGTFPAGRGTAEAVAAGK